MKKALVISLFMFLIPLSVFAHSGRTNPDGGHYDSSIGEYHYHHGYSAHSHNNGICPYDFHDAVDHISTSFTKAINNFPIYKKASSGTPVPKISPTVVYAQSNALAATSTERQEKHTDASSIIPGIILFLISPVSWPFLYWLWALVSKIIPFIKQKKREQMIMKVPKEYLLSEAQTQFLKNTQKILERNMREKYLLKEKELENYYRSAENDLKNRYLHLRDTYMKEQEQHLAESTKLLKSILADAKGNHPELAKAFSDYEQYIGLTEAYRLKHKTRPALKASESVAVFSKRNKELMEKLKLTEYELAECKTELKEYEKIFERSSNK